LPDFARLYWRLLWDRRTPILPKAVLVLSVLYVLLPFDLVPDALPIIGEVDDLVIVLAACRLFIALCPGDLVHEHVRRIGERS
jgi:uncharacterized membrane protein YkvA (DUF1232 family)